MAAGSSCDEHACSIPFGAVGFIGILIKSTVFAVLMQKIKGRGGTRNGRTSRRVKFF